MKGRIVLAVGWVTLMSGIIGLASDVASGGEAREPLRMELVPEVVAVSPGGTFTVGLRLEHGSGWHTYWKNPGIVGVATQIEWDLPAGFSAGPIQWPQPEVVKMAQVDAYGYEGEAILLVDITAPEELKGREVVLKARVIYMACAATCHPGFRDIELRLPVSGETGKAGGSKIDGEVHEAFERVRATFAEEIPGWQFAASRKGKGKLVLEVAADSAVEAAPMRPEAASIYFFDVTGVVHSNKPQQCSGNMNADGGGGFSIEMAVAPFAPEGVKYLEGVLYSDAGWMDNDGRTVKAMKVSAPFENKPREK